MHVAAALGTPVVVPFEARPPNSPARACREIRDIACFIRRAMLRLVFLRECPIDFPVHEWDRR